MGSGGIWISRFFLVNGLYWNEGNADFRSQDIFPLCFSAPVCKIWCIASLSVYQAMPVKTSEPSEFLCILKIFLAIDFLSMIQRPIQAAIFFHEWLVALRQLSISFPLSCEKHRHKWILAFLRPFYILAFLWSVRLWEYSKYCWKKTFPCQFIKSYEFIDHL